MAAKKLKQKLLYFGDDEKDLLEALEASNKGFNQEVRRLLRLGLYLSKAGYDINDFGQLTKISTQIEISDLHNSRPLSEVNQTNQAVSHTPTLKVESSIVQPQAKVDEKQQQQDKNSGSINQAISHLA